jgi:hypothetical protein
MPAPALVRSLKPLRNLHQFPKIVLWQKSHAAGHDNRPDRATFANTERKQMLNSRGLQGNLPFTLQDTPRDACGGVLCDTSI